MDWINWRKEMFGRFFPTLGGNDREESSDKNNDDFETPPDYPESPDSLGALDWSDDSGNGDWEENEGCEGGDGGGGE